MLFHIHESIREAAEQLPPLKYIIDFTEEIFRARRLGRHIIYADIATLDSLMKLPGLSDRTIHTIHKIRDRVRLKKAIFQSTKTLVRIVSNVDICRRLFENNQTIIEVSANTLTEDCFREITFLVENRSDGIFYQHISYIYNCAVNPTSGLRQVLDILPGGGSQTPREYEILLAKKQLTLCIVDGDLERPNGALGTNTALPITRLESRSTNALCKAIILGCYSIENLMPPSLIADAYNNEQVDAPWVPILNSLYSTKLWQYLPLKKTKTCSAFRGQTPTAVLWREHRHCFLRNDNPCKSWEADDECQTPCVIFDGLSDKTLANVVKYLENAREDGSLRNFAQLIDVLPEPIAELWKSVADNVTSWSCSGDRMTTA